MTQPPEHQPDSCAPAWLPSRAYFEADAMDYPHGQALHQRLRDAGCPVQVMPSGHRTPRLGRARDPASAYVGAKRTLVAGVHRGKTFQSCRPSADYQLPLVTSCPGRCAYCYLQTTLGVRPFVRVWVNVEETLTRAAAYAARTADTTPEACVVAAAHTAGTTPETHTTPTTFEASATGDPLATEHLTGLLSAAVAWAGSRQDILLRVATKFAGGIEPLLPLEHQRRTRVRLSVNPPDYVERWESGTATLAGRLEAARRLAAAGYPVGFLVAPVFAGPAWQERYQELFAHLAATMRGVRPPQGVDGHGLTIEIVTHRFTPRARDLIESRHAAAGLPLAEAGRAWRMGPFGYGKYVYDAETMASLRRKLPEMVAAQLPEATLLYIV